MIVEVNNYTWSANHWTNRRNNWSTLLQTFIIALTS